jgi:Pectate lyase superfamily protein
MTSYPPAPDSRAGGDSGPAADNNTNSNAIAAAQGATAALVGGPSFSASIPAGNSANAAILANLAAFTGAGAGPHLINVAAFGAVGNGTTDDTTAIADALAAVPTDGAIVHFPAGQYKVTSTLTAPWNALLQGHGLGTQILSHVTGDTFVMSNPTTPGGVYSTQEVQSGGFRDLMIDGSSAGNGSSGIHIGNGLGYTVENVLVRNFTGTDSIGIWVDNSIWWTEKAYFRTTVANCTTCYQFTNESTGTGSFEYNYFDMVAYWTTGQTGWSVSSSNDDPAFFGGTFLYWRGNNNGATPGPFLALAGGVTFKRCNLIFAPECNSPGTPVTIADNGGGTNHFSDCTGWMDFGANTWGASTMAAGNLELTGSVQGDATLQALRTGVAKPTVTTPGVPAASTPVTNDTGMDVMVYIPAGGTAVNVNVNGNPTGLGSGSFYIRQGETISLGAYSGAPGSWLWHGGPYP